jgi:hypothetical protein
MGKKIFPEYLSSHLFSENSLIYCKCCPSPSLRDKAARSPPFPVLLLFLILILPCITGCVQNPKYVEAYLEVPPTQDKSLKEPSSLGNMALKDNVPIDPRTCLELDFQPKVGRNSFRLSGDLVLKGNNTIPYLMLNATLWGRGLLVEKAKYMLIQVEPGKKYIFDIYRNLRVAQGEYDCILDVSGPYGSLFSENRRCLIIDESAERNMVDRNPDAEEKSTQNVSESSKMWNSGYKVQSQNGNVEENRGYDGNLAATSAERASGISKSADRVKASNPANNESVGGEDAVDRKVQLNRISKSTSVETNRMSNSNRAAMDSNKSDGSVGGMYVGSSGSNKYHRPDCRFVDKIKNKIYFKSAEEARKNGRVPCKTCSPP